MSATVEAMPNVKEAPRPAEGAGQPLKLTLSAGAAAKQIAAWVGKGAGIRKHRLRDLADLDKARAEKRAWVEACADLLRKLFDGPAVAEACNDWVGRVLPEYAPTGLFIEQFYEEMDHRLRRLQAVVDHLEDMAADDAPAPAATSGTAAAPTPKRDGVKTKALNWARLFPTAEELTANIDAEPKPEQPRPEHSTNTPSADGKPTPPQAGVLPPVVKPVGLLLAASAEQAKAVSEFLADLAVTPRVITPADIKPNDPEGLMSGSTAPAFALVWPGGESAAPRFQFQLGFLVGRLGLSRVCLMEPVTGVASASSEAPVATVALDAHGGWQLPLARTLKRAGVQVDLNRLC